MHQRKYFTLNFFINEIFSVEKFPNYGILKHCVPLVIGIKCHINLSLKTFCINLQIQFSYVAI